jgi:methylmalonyl-CoA mutase N-terminal domain/subunit
VVVGVNRFDAHGRPPLETFALDPDVERQQATRVQALRARRDAGAWRAALDTVAGAARGRDNLVPPIIAAVEAGATVGEIADTMRDVFGEFREVAVD